MIRCNIPFPFFSVFCVGFSLLIFLLSSTRMLLLGIFPRLWYRRSWWFFSFLLKLHSFHCFQAVFRLELPLAAALYVPPSSVIRTYHHPIPSWISVPSWYPYPCPIWDSLLGKFTSIRFSPHMNYLISFTSYERSPRLFTASLQLQLRNLNAFNTQDIGAPASLNRVTSCEHSGLLRTPAGPCSQLQSHSHKSLSLTPFLHFLTQFAFAYNYNTLNSTHSYNYFFNVTATTEC